MSGDRVGGDAISLCAFFDMLLMLLLIFERLGGGGLYGAIFYFIPYFRSS